MYVSEYASVIMLKMLSWSSLCIRCSQYMESYILGIVH